jgi:hypothetical protein
MEVGLGPNEGCSAKGGKKMASKTTPSPGRTIAQAVSRCIPTTAARVQSRVWSSGICGGQSGAGAGFLRVLQFPPPIFFPSNSPGAGYNRPTSGRRAEWIQLESTPD